MLLDMLLLFAASFLVATIFPAQSEAVLASLHLSGQYSVLPPYTVLPPYNWSTE